MSLHDSGAQYWAEVQPEHVEKMLVAMWYSDTLKDVPNMQKLMEIVALKVEQALNRCWIDNLNFLCWEKRKEFAMVAICLRF